MKIRKYRLKKAMVGYLFISPFLIGFAFLFLGFIIQTFQFSRSQITIGSDMFTLTSVGWANFQHIFLVNAEIRVELLSSIGIMIPEVIMIVIFSFFAATLINQKFIGRTFARAVMFLPIILTSGVILSLEMNDVMVTLLSDTSTQAQQLDGESLQLFSSLYEIVGSLTIDIGDRSFNLLYWVLLALESIYDIIIASGVQILVFLAGLQAIPPTLYEAATIDGATRWELFWKITFPMVSPLILVNVVYSVIDSFTKPTNTVMQTISNLAFNQVQYGLSAALAISYFLLVMAVLGIVVALISKKVFYYD